MDKLTLVSITVNGRRVSRFVMAKMENGKAVVSPQVFSDLCDDAGCVRGQTYTFGG